MSTNKPFGFLSFTLHAHLPYVVNHGTWPHGIEWLLEAAAETYLPLLRVLRNLEHDGVPFHFNLNLSPILLEQLAHPVFRAEFPRYLERKITAASEDESFFNSTGEPHYAETARFWLQFFGEALEDLRALDGDIAKGFQHFAKTGAIEIITSGATHGYMPLLGTDESVRAQIRTAVATHKRYFGEAPRGIWLPECGYRPAGRWSYPMQENDASKGASFDRIGIEQALAESGLQYFFVDTHLIEQSARSASPYELLGRATLNVDEAVASHSPRNLYEPYFVAGVDSEKPSTSVFVRDPRTGLQVWSGENGYPGDPDYLDFHKKRWPGGHRYWRVTDHHADINVKQPYHPQVAAERVKEHAAHFVHVVWNTLQNVADGHTPILTAPFDAELFGHWWFEGPMWLEAVARNLHDYPTGLETITSSAYLEKYPRAATITMPEGSWGAGGDNRVWLNPETSWTYKALYAAELKCREICSGDKWKRSELGERIVKQLCRELLLLESSDWQFLITTGAARDYAELRFNTHHEQFNDLQALWQVFAASGGISPGQEIRLAEIELRDSIFADIEPTSWAHGAREQKDSKAAGAEQASKTDVEESSTSLA